ncbi:hypothetical protein K440DRAFT_644330 [Wilcoxina mikolae CBS 423.85]|nr:hypothetical protein K440DRAFT_644330 [Wilcoxina mikolae CBS 423.85]
MSGNYTSGMANRVPRPSPTPLKEPPGRWRELPDMAKGLKSIIKQIMRGPYKTKKRVVRFVEDEPPLIPRPIGRKASLNTVPNTAERIEDLCSEIGKATATRSNLSIGILVDASNKRWHRIWPPSPSILPYVSESVTLYELLRLGCLQKRDRLDLGVKLASVVMQLHGTPWLGESWSSNDILSVQTVITRRTKSTGNLPCEYVQTYEPVIEYPFVRRTFGSEELVPLEEITPLPKEPANIPEYDKSLFSLGIVLIELCISQDPTVYIPTMDHTDDATAQQRIGEFITYAGDYYGLAVSRCINGLDRPGGHGPPRASQNTLDNEVFKSNAHTSIVCLLEKNLEVHLPELISS